ncbi:M23 family metallopeptidase [Mitsuaria sp. WAJ17]|uniref:M23 family metallopeptidase n=1 Tax=Mitsuaria sp. WAJ17 TaxID=2761452 RepID=UPI001603692B|nr:M23 family metallopeptidase [Mitsuaria sp. WAJ17]MBB2485195.1 M23 family metallopeptidase [Mitsuaria sp. WAJ17]
MMASVRAAAWGVVILVAGLLAGCGGGSAGGGPASGAAQPADSVNLDYQVSMPVGKVHWPHHGPSMDAAAHERLMSTLWVSNNFGLYQGNGTPESMYLHDGLDIVLPNGTPLYAMADGRVVYRGSAGNGEMLVVEDTQGEGWCWMYVHVGQVRVKLGDPVRNGQQLAVVDFRDGLQHLHLNRARAVPGQGWGENYLARDPTPLLVLKDAEPPEIQSPLLYLRSGSEELLGRGSGSTVSGRVDIVAALRDRGSYANPVPGAVPVQRLAPSLIAWEISDGSGRVLKSGRFDFTRFGIQGFLQSPQRKARQAQFLFKVPEALGGDVQWRTGFSYYLLNHLHQGLTEVGDARPQDQDWDTTELLADGRRLWPDGAYTVQITVTDATGLSARATETIQVRN